MNAQVADRRQVVLLDHVLALLIHTLRTGRRFFQHLQRLGRIKAGLLRQRQAFGQRHAIEREYKVDDQLDRRAIAMRTHVNPFAAHRFKQRNHRVVNFFFAAEHEDRVFDFGHRTGAADRAIGHLHALRLELGGECLRLHRVGGRGVQQNEALASGLKQLQRITHHVIDDF